MAIAKALAALGYEGVAIARKIAPGRYEVTIRGEYIGVWDMERNTFVD